MKEFVETKLKKDCCACGACLNICPQKAIYMEQDEFGNYYPKINKEKCIKCGACERICLFDKYTKTRENLKCYATYSNNNDILLKSSSGGVFSSVAEKFIECGGIVCGCTLSYKNDKFLAEHIIIDNKNDLYKLQGSKYVQSNIANVLPQIKQYLNKGKKVLFSGTPCQIVGLKSYLIKDYDNLYTIDIVCHGAPDVKVFQDYITYIEKKKKVKITEIKFRDKTNGLYGYGYWHGHYLKNNKDYKMIFANNESSYYYLFQKGYLYRPNCYHCPFACENRPGDITIGDYWGIEKEHPELLNENRKGFSCLIINNSQGENLINDYGKNLIKHESSFEKIQRNNSQLKHPTEEPEQNKELMDIYIKNGYEAVEKEFKKIIGLKRLLKYKVKNRIKLFIKR